METGKTTDESSWLELLGGNDWQGLLDPFDLSLRRLLIKCGEFCQAGHDAFNNDDNSKYAGSSRYGKTSFFRKVMLLEHASKYKVDSFLYATSEIRIMDPLES